MPSKTFSLVLGPDNEQPVTIVKRSSSRSLRLSITAKNEIRVSMPTWLPYRAGLQFAKSRQAWIAEHVKPVSVLQHGHSVGKAHHLVFTASPGAQRVSSRIIQSEIIIKYPATLSTGDPAVQQVAEAASLRALKAQAEKLLPQRLQSLAQEHGFSYKSVRVKRLTSRWGSCDQDTNIVLNIYLMQLPWDCIDYVLLHELTHTEHMSHNKQFWAQLGQTVPKLSYVRKVMRSYQPVLQSRAPLMR